MTRRQPLAIKQLPDSRGGDIHPLAQAVRLLTEWLAAGPLSGRQIDRLAAQRGVSPSRVTSALWTLRNRREVEATETETGLTYRLIPTHPRRKDTPC